MAPIRGAHRRGLAAILPDLAIEIVRRPDHPKGFVALPGRWIVEHTLVCSTLSKADQGLENITRKALVFLRPASIRLSLMTHASKAL